MSQMMMSGKDLAHIMANILQMVPTLSIILVGAMKPYMQILSPQSSVSSFGAQTLLMIILLCNKI